MRIVLLGPPASGKGTQAAMISEQLSIPTVSTGALLRDEKARETSLGIRADQLTRDGHMVPDELINSIIQNWLPSAPANGFILDGYPRTIPQAETFEKLLTAAGLKLHLALYLDVSVETIRMRVQERLVCKSCGTSLNMSLHAAKEADACPKCGGVLGRRNDDTLEVLEQRLQEYRQKTEPLVGFYRERGLLAHIHGEGHPKPVFQQIQEALSLAAR